MYNSNGYDSNVVFIFSIKQTSLRPKMKEENIKKPLFLRNQNSSNQPSQLSIKRANPEIQTQIKERRKEESELLPKRKNIIPSGINFVLKSTSSVQECYIFGFPALCSGGSGHGPFCTSSNGRSRSCMSNCTPRIIAKI